MIEYYLLLLMMTLLGSVASLFLKRASGEEGLLGMLKSSNLYLGAFLYLASAVLNILILRVLDYSIVLPLTSITYVWTMVLSYLVLKERITGEKIAGIAMILAGAICVSM